MEIYFNPYPGAAKTEEEAIRLAIGTADSLSRLKQGCVGVVLSASISEPEVELPPSRFILVRNKNLEFTIGSLIFKTGNVEREKLRLLLDLFSRGRIICNDELLNVNNWIVSAIGTSAPLLELAAKNKALALTIPTEPEWRIDIIKFDDRLETLHNLWGQNDISEIIKHCLDSISNNAERFCIMFNVKFCKGALNSAPNTMLWDSFGFFQTMERAKNRNYQIDKKLIKSVADTKYGHLLELRMHSTGHRIFFVNRKDRLPELLVGGFYQKNEALSQDEAIQQAKKRIDDHSEDEGI